MRRFLLGLMLLVGAAAALFYVLTMPKGLPAEQIAAEASGDAARGERIFWAGGCASCHAAPNAEGDAKLVLAGGEPLVTEFGTFHAPNISPDPRHGIGGWSLADFANAMQRGVTPAGRHLYPAFPYTSYSRMASGDIADLWAYLKTLPSAATDAPANDLAFPFNIRRGIGLWKLAFLDTEPVISLSAEASDIVRRGQYLVEGPGHCGECHTPRRLWGLGGLDETRWLAGGPAPEGQGRIPNITPGGEIGGWSEEDLVNYFQTGFTPDFDSVGGSMAEVQENLSHLPEDDLRAISAYLKAVPAVGDEAKSASSQ